MSNAIDAIKKHIAENTILLFMKGSPQLPQCGFSSRAVQILIACNQRFGFVDVLSHPEIRAALPGYANWPTFPQLWVNGELIGGSDIITQMYESKDLAKLFETIPKNIA